MNAYKIWSKKFPLAVAALVIVAVAAGAWWLRGSPGDVTLLARYGERYNYERLKELVAERPGDSERFTFVVLGDTRNNVFIASKVFQEAADEDPVAVFHTGDLIRRGTVREYLNNHIPLLEIVDPVPVFCVPGNHERGARHDFAAFRALYGDTRFSFDHGVCRFVGFNVSEKMSVTNEELRFLDRELAKPGATYKFVFFHIPPKYFEREIATDDSRGVAWNAEDLREILVRHQVDEVFMAHIHGYATAVIDGVRYTLTAGGGAPFSERLPEEGRIFHYMAVHVSPEGLSEELVYMDDDAPDNWRRKGVY